MKDLKKISTRLKIAKQNIRDVEQEKIAIRFECKELKVDA